MPAEMGEQTKLIQASTDRVVFYRGWPGLSCCALDDILDPELFYRIGGCDSVNSHDQCSPRMHIWHRFVESRSCNYRNVGIDSATHARL